MFPVIATWVTLGFLAGFPVALCLDELVRHPTVQMRVFAGIVTMVLLPLLLVGFFVKGGHELYRVWRPLPTLPEARVV